MRIILIFAVLLISCNQQKKSSNNSIEILDHFGSLKIGMQRTQFEYMFPNCSRIKDAGYNIRYNIQKFQFSKTIILETVYIVFENDKLALIGTKCNDKLIIYLKKKYGQSHESIINTNSKNINCAIENDKTHCIIALFKQGYYPDYN